MALIVFTGGARSGKSRAAQELAHARALEGIGVTVAVFGLPDIDEEFAARIEAHRADRPAEWATIEVAALGDWERQVPEDRLLVVDCLGTMLGLAMDEVFRNTATDDGRRPDGLSPHRERDVEEAFAHHVAWLAGRAGDTIVVTNEVGDGVVPASASGRVFRDVLGRANRLLVDAADAAYLVVCGRLVPLHAQPRTALWPTD